MKREGGTKKKWWQERNEGKGMICDHKFGTEYLVDFCFICLLVFKKESQFKAHIGLKHSDQSGLRFAGILLSLYCECWDYIWSTKPGQSFFQCHLISYPAREADSSLQTLVTLHSQLLIRITRCEYLSASCSTRHLRVGPIIWTSWQSWDLIGKVCNSVGWMYQKSKEITEISLKRQSSPCEFCSQEKKRSDNRLCFFF